jgi:hypothetical protein
MSTKSSLKDIGSPSTHIPYGVNGTPSTPSTAIVVVMEVLFLTPIRHVVATQPIVTNPFGSLFGMPGYNAQSIPSVSNPFSFGMTNVTLQLSSSIPTNNENTSLGPGGMAPPHIPLSFGGAHIPQTTPTVGIQPHFPPRSNPSINTLGWNSQPRKQDISYILSFPPSSSILISMNTFFMKNPPLTSIFPPRGSQSHAMGNPQPGATPAGGNVYNPHYVIPTGMVPLHPLMNQFEGGYYPTG